MKKRLIALMAFLAALVLCAGAVAESGDAYTAEDLFGQVTSLLFYTNNVTLKVKADFSLNGEWFKTADCVFQQDDDRSFRQVLLTSPKADGTQRKNGYTIVAGGEGLYVMEVYHPGTYKTGTAARRTSLLHSTAETDLLIRLGRALVPYAESLAGNGAVTTGADGTIRISLGENAPETVSILLNQAAQFAVKRYFRIDPDQMEADSEASVWNYNTLSEGLMNCMREVTLQSLTAEVKMDANGWIREVSGELQVNVDTPANGFLPLGIRFEAEVSDWGTTAVRRFDPADYDVVPATEADRLLQDSIENMNGEQIGALDAKAMEVWQLSGYPAGRIVADRAETNGSGFSVLTYIMEDGTALRVTFNDMNTPVGMETEPHAWENMELDYEFDPQVDPETDSKILAMLNDFLRKVNPGLAERLQSHGMVLHADRRYEINGVTFIDYCEDPLDQDGDGVGLTVRAGPEIWIEYYAAVSNG